MKEVKKLYGFLIVLLLIASNSQAFNFDFYDEVVANQQISSLSGERYDGFTANLKFPTSASSEYYPLSYNDITRFEITLAGYGNAPNGDISVYLNLNSMWIELASYTVDENDEFCLKVDLKNDKEVESYINGDDFMGIDSFQVAYGGNFSHSSTSVNLEWSGGYVMMVVVVPEPEPIPEPASLILLLAGILKLSLRSIKR